MRLTVDDRRRGTGARGPVDVEWAGGASDVTVGELVAASTGSSGPMTGCRLEVDGVTVGPGEPLAELLLMSGSTVQVHDWAPRPAPDQDRPGHALVELAEIAGPAAGLAVGLGPGTFLVGRSARPGLRVDAVDEPVVTVDVDGAQPAPVTVSGAVGAWGVRVDGRELDPDAGRRAAAVLAVGDAVFRLRPLSPFDVGGPVTRPDPNRDGQVPLARTPRIASPPPDTGVEIPAAPEPPRPPQPLSWLVMLAPLPIGIVLALVFSPLFLLMTTMTPLMALARWIEGKQQAKKGAARHLAETAAMIEQFAADVDGARVRAGEAARACHPDLAELARRARTGRGLWEVRPGDDDELRLAVGSGTVAWTPGLSGRPETLRAFPGLRDVLAQRSSLVDVPVLVDLRERTGAGITGPAADSRRLAAAMVLDLVTRHGPADVRLSFLLSPDAVAAWEWAKWLPHATDDDGGVLVAMGEGPAAALLGRLAGAPQGQGPRPVLVVDGEDLLTGRVGSLLGRLAGTGARILVLSRGADRIPSACRWLLELDARGELEVTDTLTGTRTPGVVAARAASEVCGSVARALAGWADPERQAAAASLPDRVRLLDVLAEAEPVLAGADRHALLAAWRSRSGGLRTTVGVGESGPLTLDLLADGPHGLVVGTTGSGKSELLRSLVASLAARYSPDDLTFMLVDFKGGGAFDACVGLPHTVGLVTDLDEHLAARALACLRAELRHREQRLREAGVSDLRDYPAPDPPLPRLLIVIDEFATLAVELPGFLSALVDVAQRGRSLGIHLLLATQRPQGVVDGKIRANTNLRIALRVQDDADSRDVLGTRHAAEINRRQPGRAYVRLGAGEVVAFQAALVSASHAAEDRRLDVRPFRLVADPGPATSAGVPDGVPTDLETLVREAQDAAHEGGYRAPRVPWPAPLPDELAPADLAAEPGGAGGRVALGLVDLPDEQRAEPWCWAPEDGAMILLGARAGAVSGVLATACVELARGRDPQQLGVVVLDGLGGALAALDGLPHATVVGVDDAELLGRVLDHVDSEIAARRAAPPGTASPTLLVVVAGWGAVVEACEQAGIADAGGRLERVLRDGPVAGVHVLASAPHERGVPGRVLAQIPRKLVMELADPGSYTALGLRLKDMPTLRGLRAVDLSGAREVHLARYGGGSPQALATEIAAVASAAPASSAASATTATGPGPRIEVLPTSVPFEDVVGAARMAGSVWRIPVGRRYEDLSVADLALAPGTHVVVTGPAGSGRTSTLSTIAAAARAGAPDAVIAVVAADPAPWDGLGCVTEAVGSVDALTCWPPGGGRGLLLVDGVEDLGHAVTSRLDGVIAALPPGCHLVVAGRAESFRGMQAWQRAVTAARTGILLRPGSEDGEVLRVRLPRGVRPRPVPGRGYLVAAGEPSQVQVALPAPVPHLDGHLASVTKLARVAS